MGGGAEWEERTLSKLIRQVGELPVVYVLEHMLSCYQGISGLLSDGSVSQGNDNVGRSLPSLSFLPTLSPLTPFLLSPPPPSSLLPPTLSFLLGVLQTGPRHPLLTGPRHPLLRGRARKHSWRHSLRLRTALRRRSMMQRKPWSCLSLCTPRSTSRYVSRSFGLLCDACIES